MSEADLIGRSQAGDTEAFRLLAERYRSVLARTAYLTVRDRELAQDVVQETLLQVWRGLPSYRPGGSFKAWLLKVLMNQARRQYRKKRVVTVPLEEAAAIPVDCRGPDEVVLQQEQGQQLGAALVALSTEHREVLVLRFFSELTVPEIARALGCREGTVKSRLHRALGHLEQLLSKEWPHRG